MTLKACVWRTQAPGYWFAEIAAIEDVNPDVSVFVRVGNALEIRVFDTHAEAIAWAWEQVAETCPGQG